MSDKASKEVTMEDLAAMIRQLTDDFKAASADFNKACDCMERRMDERFDRLDRAVSNVRTHPVPARVRNHHAGPDYGTVMRRLRYW